ncbi:sensor domain-containing protein [Shewanella sp. 10N.286.48.B5]|uniref:sensor domain-containing protein n=1 Tax=Shewanella sp. 10N.286.48.B5 TaxID=1880834 RepID=UPI000C84C428|nr:sensor domain-containing protein [Shewanella sp. 10N.286.48.B5]PMH85032.1 hypothetical protein BCU57_15745 [Shewanella sp. 10N.286.48.B5]
METIKSNKAIEKDIQHYLRELSAALHNQDLSLVQDAKFDAESHFRAALLESSNKANPMLDIIQDYGTPQVIAQHYCDMELTVDLAFNGRKEYQSNVQSGSIFSILKDTAAFKALIYYFISFPLSMVYIAWVLLVGLSSAVASLVLIGIPVFIFFINSMRYFSLFEGRLIEPLLGERMPRRPKFLHNLSQFKSLKGVIALIKNRENWTSILYLLLQLPLSLLYFTIFVLPAVFSILLFLSPVIDPLINTINPSLSIDINWYWLPISTPLSLIGLMLSLHAAKTIGKLHARFAKSMLVSI